MREYHYEADLEAVMNVQHSMARFGSRVFHTRRYLGEAEKKHRYVFERGEDVIGFIEYQFGKGEDGKSQISVNNAWFSCDECLPALVDLTYRFASQCEMIAWEIDPEIPLEYYILEPGQVERTKNGYMMVRVVKFKEFCQRIKVPLFASEPVIVQVRDADCPWNDGVFKLTPVSGRLEIETSDRAPEICFDALHLSHAIGGQLTANRLHRMGGLQCSVDAAERFTRIFPPDSYVTYTGF
jgi:predicted acetyltransferase